MQISHKNNFRPQLPGDITLLLTVYFLICPYCRLYSGYFNVDDNLR